MPPDVVLASANQADLHEFEAPDFHDQMVRALDSAARRPHQLTGALLALTSAGTTIVGLMVALVALAPSLLLVVVIGAGPLLWTARQATRQSYAFNVAQTERDRRRAYFNSALASRTSAAEIRVFGIGDELRGRIKRLHSERIEDLERLARIRGRLSMLGVVVSVAVAGFVMFGLAQRFESGDLGLAQATVAAAAFLVLSQRLQGFSAAAASVLECALFLGDIDRFTERQVDKELGPKQAIESLRLEDVAFSYPAAEVDAIRHVDLELRTGELVALVGENGSGKSTIARILSLLYHPTAGTIRVNGEPVSADDAPDIAAPNRGRASGLFAIARHCRRQHRPWRVGPHRRHRPHSLKQRASPESTRLLKRCLLGSTPFLVQSSATDRSCLEASGNGSRSLGPGSATPTC